MYFYIQRYCVYFYYSSPFCLFYSLSLYIDPFFPFLSCYTILLVLFWVFLHHLLSHITSFPPHLHFPSLSGYAYLSITQLSHAFPATKHVILFDWGKNKLVGSTALR